MTPEEYRGRRRHGCGSRSWLPADEVKRVARLYVNVTLCPAIATRSCSSSATAAAPAARPVERVIEVEHYPVASDVDGRDTRHEMGSCANAVATLRQGQRVLPGAETNMGRQSSPSL